MITRSHFIDTELFVILIHMVLRIEQHEFINITKTNNYYLNTYVMPFAVCICRSMIVHTAVGDLEVTLLTHETYYSFTH